MSHFGVLMVTLGALGVAALPDSSVNRRDKRSAQSSLRVDTIRVSRAALARALDNPSACQSPGQTAGEWPRGQSVVQAGEIAFVAGGEIVMLDAKESRVHAYSADGRDLGQFGSKGAGPGEFRGSAHLVPWTGDTVAVHAVNQAHLVLYRGHRYERTVILPKPLGSGNAIANARLAGANAVVFASYDAFDYVPRQTEIVRSTFSLVLWQSDTPLANPIRRNIPASEFTVWTEGGGSGSGRMLANFGRKTFIGVLQDQVALFDNATQSVELIEMSGRVRRVVALDIPDVPVIAADRDSAAQENKTSLARFPIDKEGLEKFPRTRSSISQLSADNVDGFWITVASPIAKGTPLHIRFTAAGEPDRCVRVAGNARIAAFGKDRVVTVVETDDGDVINVARTMPFRRQG